MSEEIEITVEIDKDLGYHENLKGRNELNQHPISSIIDLQETLTTLDDNIAEVNDKADSLKEELKLIEITGTPVDYDILINKPQINSIELTGNKTLEELNIQPAGDYVVNETLTEYAKTENIPAKVSQLENDTGYLVESSLDNYATKEEIPTLTSQLTNDSNFLSSIPEEYITEQELTETLNTTSENINQQINTKADKATTIAGYGITDAYTKTEIDEALNDKANSSGLSAVATSGSYNDLTNKPNIITSYNELLETPQIEGVDLKGNKSLTDLGIQPAGTYLTEIPAEYVTETELNGKGYITSAALEGYAQTSEIPTDYLTEADLEGYAQVADIPTNTSDLTNDSGFITKEVSNLTNYTSTSELSAVATSGSYDDLTNKPTIPQEYTLPTASETTLGGVKVDNETITIQDGTISATAASYTLPQASATTLGGVKIDGETITINEEGVISSQGGTTSDPLTINSLNVGTITGTGSTTLNQENLSNVLSLDGDGLIFGDAKAFLENTVDETESFNGAWVLKDKFGVVCYDANIDDTMTNGTLKQTFLEVDGPNFTYTGASGLVENGEGNVVSLEISLQPGGIKLIRDSEGTSTFSLELKSHGAKGNGQINMTAAPSTMGVAVSLRASYTDGLTLSFYREGVIDEEYTVLTSQVAINTLPETPDSNEQHQVPTVQLLRNTIGDIGSVLDSINGETV